MDIAIKEYEIAFLLRTEEAIAQIIAALKAQGAEIGVEGTLRKVALTYPILKMNEAFFGFCHFRLTPDHVAALDHALRVSPAVLRFLIITPPFVQSSAMPMRPRMEASPIRETPPPRAEALPLSNEDLEKKIGEILQ